jgi:hypothetical protein
MQQDETNLNNATANNISNPGGVSTAIAAIQALMAQYDANKDL